MKKIALNILSFLVFAALLTPLWVFSHLQFPFITSKAFFFRIVIELAVPFYLYLIVIQKSLRPEVKNYLNLAVLIFVAVNILSALFGVNVARSFLGNFERMGGVYYLVHLTILYFYVQLLGQAGGQYLKRFLQFFVGVAVFVTLNGLLGWLGGPTLTLDPSLPARVSSTFGNPIFFASFLIIPFFLALYFVVLEENKVWKIIYALAAILQFVAILASGTRGALVGLSAGILAGSMYYISAAQNRKLRFYGFLVVGLLIVSAGILYGLRDKLPESNVLYRVMNLRDSNSQARLIQWKTALLGSKENFILGVGPENYYFIANKYYNPQITQYDPSWFDKPHNFLLEVLDTNGILGLLVYMSMFGLAIYGIWKAYKSELIGFIETVLLISAITSYQVQNLFVFDTVTASVVFYGFMGFIAFMWAECDWKVGTKTDISSKSTILGPVVFISSFAIMLGVLYISNITSIQAAKLVSKGYNYTNYNSAKAAEAFESAVKLPFNLDPRETANRYSDFAVTISNNIKGDLKSEFILDQLNKATFYQRKITAQTKNDPLLWMRLALDELSLEVFNRQNFTASKAAAEKALEFSPKRFDLVQLQLQIVGREKDWPKAQILAEEIVRLNPYNSDLQWQLAMIYFLNDNIDQAVKAGDLALEQGYKFKKLQEFAWYIQYYESKQNYERIAPLLEQAVSLEPNEIGLYVELAKVYANLGNYEKARLLAEQVANSDPSQKATMDAFIKTLQ